MDAPVLLTGATGYIGGRLLRHFEEAGRPVRCLARNPERVRATRSTTEVVQGDCLDEASLDLALAGVDSAYYLVHSMSVGADFAEVDRHAAANFGRAAARAGVRRIIYLGGLADQAGSLSSHLQSRAETGSVLRASGVPVIEFRASIVVGAGSLSFQMIEALVERLPVMVCPRWVATLTQPMAVDDVVAYLAAALELPDTGSEVFEIGGPDVVSYGDIMREYAQLRGLRRWLLPVPLLTPHLSGLWLALVTPAQARVGRALVEGLKNPTVVRSSAACDAFQIEPTPLRVALAKAIEGGARLRQKVDTRTTVRRRAPVAGLCSDQADWRHERLVLRELPLASARLAGPRFRRRGHGTRPPRSRELRADRCHRRLDRRGVRTGSTPAAQGRSEVARPRLAGIPGHAARRRPAIAHPPDGDVRPSRPAGPRVLVRPPSRARVDVQRSPA